MAKIDCNKCRKQSYCCRTGAWVDLEEAKKIIDSGIKGKFYHFEEDSDFPSGYKVATSYKYNRCSFLTRKGLCSIHKKDYNLKPSHCRDFPYENGKIAPFVGDLCLLFKKKIKNKR